MSTPSLLFVEPHRRGYKHATVNAALLEAASTGLGGWTIEARLHPAHLQWIREVAPRRTTAKTCIGPLPEPSASLRESHRGRAVSDLILYARILAEARREEIQALLLTSTTPLGVSALKLLIPWLLPGKPVLVITHQINDLTTRDSAPEPSSSRRLARALTLASPPNLRFLAPGSVLLDALRASHPELAGPFCSLELPYVWQRDSCPKPPRPEAGEPVVFGVFGLTRGDSLAALGRVAKAVHQCTTAVRFLLVGFCREPLLELPAGCEHVEGLGTTPLSHEELARRAREAHYALWVRNPGEYRMRLSASLLDAFSFLLPTVTLANPFARFCFERMGDIGYLCEGESALVERIVDLVRCFPRDRYRYQCETVRCGRQLFAPTRAGARLRELILGRRPESHRPEAERVSVTRHQLSGSSTGGSSVCLKRGGGKR